MYKKINNFLEYLFEGKQIKPIIFVCIGIVIGFLMK